MFLLHKYYPKAFAAVFTFSIAVALVMVMFGIFVIKDALEFRENFGVEKNIFVLSENNNYLSAVVLNFQSEDAKTAIFEYDNITFLESKVEQGLAPDNYYKVLILDRTAFDDIQIKDVYIGMASLDKNELLQTLYSDDPTTSLRKIVSKQEVTLTNSEIRQMYGDNDMLRQTLFTNVLIDVFSSDPLVLIRGVKNGNIIILPETLMFKTIKYIPVYIFEQAKSFVDKEVENELDGQG